MCTPISSSTRSLRPPVLLIHGSQVRVLSRELRQDPAAGRHWLRLERFRRQARSLGFQLAGDTMHDRRSASVLGLLTLLMLPAAPPRAADPFDQLVAMVSG